MQNAFKTSMDLLHYFRSAKFALVQSWFSPHRHRKFKHFLATNAQIMRILFLQQNNIVNTILHHRQRRHKLWCFYQSPTRVLYTVPLIFQLLPPAPYCLWRSCLRSLCNHKQVCIALTYLQHSLLHKRESLLSNNVAEGVQQHAMYFSNSYPATTLPYSLLLRGRVF